MGKKKVREETIKEKGQRRTDEKRIEIRYQKKQKSRSEKRTSQKIQVNQRRSERIKTGKKRSEKLEKDKEAHESSVHTTALNKACRSSEDPKHTNILSSHCSPVTIITNCTDREYEQKESR